IVGNEQGNIFKVINTGTSGAARWEAPAQIAGIDVGRLAKPTLGDLNGDGTYDLLVRGIDDPQASSPITTLYTTLGVADPRITVTVTREVDLPTQDVNAGLTLSEGADATITETLLDFDDKEQADSDLTYPLVLDGVGHGGTANGTLWLD